MISKKEDLEKLEESKKFHTTTYGTRYFREFVPKYEIPEKGMPPNAAYQIVHDEMNLDGNPSLNLASFVTTWMEPEATKLVMENISKNFIDHFEYPQTEVIQKRVVNMLARLFNAPEETNFAGTATIGSSEAIMLGLLAHKWAWKKRRKSQGKPHNKPNIIFGADAHVCWDKFAKYFDVEPRIVPMETDRFTIGPETVADLIDENTICVGAILGTTFTGEADPIKEINDLLVEIKRSKGWDIPIHVDAASGGFITPFVNPELVWDFRLPQVKSINVSGHKYGLVYPGLGWLIFREYSDLPEDLIFYVNYLGDEMPTYTLNFSRGAAMVIVQYYNLIRLGREGYKNIATNTLKNARYLVKHLTKMGKFDMLNTAKLLPIVTFKLKEPANYTPFDLSHKLRERGWIVPAYTLPPNAESIAIMRVVVKENFSEDMADMLATDILKACEALEGTKKEEIVGRRSPREGHHIT
ncbi:MAG: glutamate decarboxylase [archaeon]|nr:glutamate decarboxylase [archaeon]MCP8306323.1 glutamate decarboxylase [archaeon]